MLCVAKVDCIVKNFEKEFAILYAGAGGCVDSVVYTGSFELHIITQVQANLFTKTHTILLCTPS
jgi:hypothetical protein